MLELTRDCYDEIVYHGYEGADEEVCGVLAGEYSERESRVVDTYPVENPLRSVLRLLTLS